MLLLLMLLCTRAPLNQHIQERPKKPKGEIELEKQTQTTSRTADNQPLIIARHSLHN